MFLLRFSINLLVSYYRVQNCNQLVTNGTENGVLVTRIWRLVADYLSVSWSDIQELVPLQCIFSHQKTSWKTSCVCVSLWNKKIILLTPFGNHIFHLATEKKFQSPVGACLKKLISNCVLWMLFSDWPCYSLCIWWEIVSSIALSQWLVSKMRAVLKVSDTEKKQEDFDTVLKDWFILIQ